MSLAQPLHPRTELPWLAGSEGEFPMQALLRAMLQHEAAMARSFSALGLIRKEEALSIASTCRLELLDAAQLVRETLGVGDAEPAQGERVPPVMQRLRETVALFNPQAAQEVFRMGITEALQRNALMLLTRAYARELDQHLASLVQALSQRSVEQVARVVRARERIAALVPRALGLRLATRDAAVQARATDFQTYFCAELGLSAEDAVAPPAQADDWTALGLEYCLLNRCWMGLVDDPALALDKRSRITLEAQAQRMPLDAAQWMSALPTEADHDDADFWAVVWPQWAHLTHQTASSVALLSRTMAQAGAPR